MRNEKREIKFARFITQMDFCELLIDTLRKEVSKNFKEQEADPWDNNFAIKNHTQASNDIKYIRRQFLKMEKELKEW